MRAIVLSGGGAKGAYQIGVWKALRRLHISYDIVTGTSVGALNGAFFVQRDYKKALKMWQNMNFEVVFDKDLKPKGTFSLLKTYLKEMIRSGGMDVKGLEKTLTRYLSIPRFYHSKVDFGIVTLNLSNLKPIQITKKEIKEEELADYLIASATFFPVFKKKEIDGKYYIDGGCYDNLPINLAISMGATEVIAVNLHEIGVTRKIRKKDIPIIEISPRNNLGNLLSFNKESAKKAIQFGYNDTMKQFGKLEGNSFTFKKHHLFYHQLFYYKRWKKVLSQARFEGEVSKERQLEILELLGKSFGLEETSVYSIFQYRKELKKIREMFQNEKVTIRDLTSSKKRIVFFYSFLRDIKKEPRHANQILNFSSIFKKEFLAAAYLCTLK